MAPKKQKQKITRHTRYLPTVYVDGAMSTRLEKGSLILQPGQWIVLAWAGGRRARWAGVSSAGTLAVQHWEPGACYCSGTWTRHGGYCPAKWKAIRDFARGGRSFVRDLEDCRYWCKTCGEETPEFEINNGSTCDRCATTTTTTETR